MKKSIGILFFIFCILHLSSQPVANFNVSGSDFCAPISISFVNTSTNCIGTASYYWQAGNGDISTNENPTFFYSTGGVYTVSLKVSCDGFNDTKTMNVVVYDSPQANFSNTTLYGCVPFEVNFSDLSLEGSGEIDTWVWYFGDGNTSNVQNPMHIYNTSGNFNVTLLIQDENSCTSQISHNNVVKVANLPNISFVADNPTMCTSPHTVNFTSTVTTSFGLNATYLWDFGDASPTSSAINPSHQYTSGIYDVSLTVTDEYGCSNIVVKEEYVRIAPTIPAYSVLEGDTVCKGMQTHFANQTGFSCHWNFGDGATSSQNTPVHIYNQTGNITCTFTVDPGGECEASTTFNLFVESVTASFTTSPTNLYSCTVPFLVDFTNTSSSNAVNFYYVFQDGSSSNQINTSHLYTSQGLFQPTLTVTSAAGCVHTYIGPLINIAPPDASFIADSVEGCAPLTVDFTYTGSSTAPISNYNWDFGNSSSNANGTTSESSVYNPGDYTVVLTVTDNQGCTASSSIEIHVGSEYVPNINVFDNDSNHSPLVSHFLCAQDTVSLWVEEWLNDDFEFTWWIDSTSNQNANDEYTDYAFDQDTGWVYLNIITFYNGCRDTTFWDSLYISGPIINGISSHYDCDNPRDYDFTLNETLAKNWDWTLYYITGSTITVIDQNNNSTDHNYSFSFPPNPDTFWLKVTAYNDTTNCVFVDSIKINITSPFSSFSIPQYVNCAYIDLIFNASASENVSEYYWDFGDGNNSGWVNEPLFIYEYTTIGIFDVVLTVRDANGCISTDTHQVQIIGPEIHVDISDVYGCDQLLVHFVDNSTADEPIVSVLWNFGDGHNLTGFDVNHLYASAGVYSVTIQVQTLSGCLGEYTFEDTITVASVGAAFNVINPTACVEQEVSLFAFENDPTYTYTWSFGDLSSNVSGALPTITHSYSSGGRYDIKLVVDNGLGCVDELLIENMITIEQVFASFSLINDNLPCYPADPGIVQNSSVVPDDTELYYQWILGINDTINMETPEYLYTMPGSFNLVLNLSSPAGCTDSYSLPLIINGPYAQAQISDTIACVGQEIEFSIINQENVDSFIWVVGGGDSYSSESFTHSYSLVPPLGFYPVNLILSSETCEVAFVYNIYVYDVHANFYITDTNNNTITSGLCTPFDAIFVNDSQDEDFRYWFVDTYPIGSGQETEIYNFVNNQDYITSPEVCLVVENIYGCLDTAKLSIDVYPLPVITITNDTLICKGDKITLDATGGISFLWSPNQNISDINSDKPVVNPSEDITYYLEVKNSYNCAKNDSVKIIVIQDFTVNFTPDIDSIIIGDTTTIVLEASQDSLSFTWTPNNHISCSNCPMPEFYPLESTRYSLLVEDSTGCFRYSYYLDIYVIEEYSLDVPDAFTPESANQNSIVYARGFGIKKLLQFRIYNRWGEEVFFTDDINQGWDGYYKGKLQNIDNYTYFIEAEMFNETIQSKKGHILLIR